MPQFMTNQSLEIGKTVDIAGADAHHIVDVLRLKKGDWIVLSDGKGSRFKALIGDIQKKDVTVKVVEKLSELEISPVTLAQAVIKHDRIEAIIQKSVEIGISKFIPFTSKRTIPKFSGELSVKKIDRWNKIAVEASKQCGLSIKPEVKPIMPFEELVQAPTDYTHKLIFFEGEKEATISHYFSNAQVFQNVNTPTRQNVNTPTRQHETTPTLQHVNTPTRNNANTPTRQHVNTSTRQHVLILIGPEGGFQPEEVEFAKEHGFAALGLGPLIMRVETAAIVAAALVQHHLGHFGW